MFTLSVFFPLGGIMEEHESKQKCTMLIKALVESSL